MKRILLISILGFAVVLLNAQIKVGINNCVGIAENSPVSVLSINDPGNIYTTAFISNSQAVSSSRGLLVRNDISTGSWGFATLMYAPVFSSSASKVVGLKVSSTASSLLTSKRSYGIWGVAGNATSGWNYGVYGELSGTGNGAAIYAIVPGTTDMDVEGIYAGYFRGKVYVEDTVEYTTFSHVSDIHLKKDIRPLRDSQESIVAKLQTLHAIKYKRKTPVELNQIGTAVTDTMAIEKISSQYNSGIYTNDQFGLSAQEVREVFPELVARHSDGYLRLNSLDLIPVLIEAIKEQEAEIELLKEQIKLLQEK